MGILISTLIGNVFCSGCRDYDRICTEKVHHLNDKLVNSTQEQICSSRADYLYCLESLINKKCEIDNLMIYYKEEKSQYIRYCFEYSRAEYMAGGCPPLNPLVATLLMLL